LRYGAFDEDDRVMSWFTWLRGQRRATSGASGDTETVRRIVAELDEMDPARARYLAAFAYVLSRVAIADSQISEAETQRILEIVRRTGHLSEEQAVLVVEIAKRYVRLFGATENYLVTREFRDVASEEQRRDMLDCLFAVSAADDEVTGSEEQQIWQIASELGFPHDEYVTARMAYSDKRSVLRRPRQP
jgi:uncharacterized tellurite resistance protein B-like protein